MKSKEFIHAEMGKRQKIVLKELFAKDTSSVKTHSETGVSLQRPV